MDTKTRTHPNIYTLTEKPKHRATEITAGTGIELSLTNVELAANVTLLNTRFGPTLHDSV